jgi:flagellar biosynthetic protein FliP
MNRIYKLATGMAWQLALLLVGGALAPAYAAAPQGVSIQIPGFTMKGDSTSWTIVLLLTLLTLLPALLLSVTPFVRILVVFHFLRQALGTQTTPSNQTLIGLSLFLTYFLMQPVAMAINQQALIPFENGTITTWEALDRGSTPLRQYMLQYTREKDLALFVEMSHEPRPKERTTSRCAS